MKNAADYLAFVRSLIIVHPAIVKIVVAREEHQGTLGLFRYRLSLRNGDLLEVFQRFSIDAGVPIVTKYSFQWQDVAGNLRFRWDNAPHHPEIETHPHHLHSGDGKILPHVPVTILDILEKLNDDNIFPTK